MKEKKKTKRVGKTNAFNVLFAELLKTLQILAEKEMTQFQKELYKNTLHSAIQSMARKASRENPSFGLMMSENPCFSQDKMKQKEEEAKRLKVNLNDGSVTPDPDPGATIEYNKKHIGKSFGCCPTNINLK